MKYYLVASVTCCMIGIEQCLVYQVELAQQAAFEKQFAGCILQISFSKRALPAAPLRQYT